LVLGLLGAVGLAGCTPIWEMLQLSGRVPFSFFWLPIFAIMLTFAVIISDTRRLLPAAICGIAFATPLTLWCLVLPKIDSRASEHFGREIRVDGILTIAFSVVVMIVVTMTRSFKDDPKVTNDA